MSRRRLLLVGLDWIRRKDPPLSLANASIAAACANFADVSTVTVNCRQPHLKVQTELTSQLLEVTASDPRPPIVALGGYVWAESILNETIRTVKDTLGKETTVVLGGPQVTYAPAEEFFLTSHYPLADGFIRGHGEEPMRRLLMDEAAPLGYVSSGHFDTGIQSKGGFASSPSPFLTGWVPPQRFLRWETQRGCPFSCSFCQHKDSANRRIALNRERIFEECDWMVRQSADGPLRDLAITDPTFNSGPTYLAVIARLAGFIGKISLQCRLEMMSDDFLRAVLGLSRSANVVLEFGVQTIHKNEQRLIERPNNLKRCNKWLELLNAEGVPYEMSYIYGLPDQTLDSFRRTLEWAEHKVHMAWAHGMMGAHACARPPHWSYPPRRRVPPVL